MGITITEVAKEIGVSPNTMRLWVIKKLNKLIEAGVLAVESKKFKKRYYVLNKQKFLDLLGFSPKYSSPVFGVIGAVKKIDKNVPDASLKDLRELGKKGITGEVLGELNG